MTTSTMPGHRVDPPQFVDELIDDLMNGGGGPGTVADSTLTDRGLCGGSVTPRTVVTGGIDATIILQDGTLTVTEFASGITPVQVVSSLPTCGASENGQVAWLTTDGQLYECDGAAWQVMTPDGSNIVANSITAGQIAAGAIGTTELAADSVDASILAAGSIYVEHLVAGFFEGLVTNPQFEADVINGADDPHFYNDGTGGTWSSGTNPRAGTRSARFDCDTYSATARINVDGSLTDPTKHFYAAEGDEVFASCWVRDAGTGTMPQVDVEIRFYDEGGSLVNSGNGANVTPTGTYQQASHSLVAQAGTAYVAISVRVITGGSSTAGCEIDTLYVRRMINNAIVASDISADKITAGTLEGRVVQTASSGDRVVMEGLGTGSTLLGIEWYEGASRVMLVNIGTAGNTANVQAENGYDLVLVGEDEVQLKTSSTTENVDIMVEPGSPVVKIRESTGGGTDQAGMAQINTDEDERVLTLYAERNTYAGSALVIFADEEAGTGFRFLRTQSDVDGTPDTEHDLEGNGDGNCDGSWSGGGADYAELFESADGKPIAPGTVLTTDGDLVRPAAAGEYVVGIVSVNPTVLGNNGLNWKGKYRRDEWGRIETRRVQKVEWKDWRIDCSACGPTFVAVTPDSPREATLRAHIAEHCPEHFTPGHHRDDCVLDVKVKIEVTRTRAYADDDTIERPAHAVTFWRDERVVSPEFDPDIEYVPRKHRDEWVAVGLMGRLYVRDDDSCVANGFATVSDVNGEVTATSDTSAWRVLRRIGPGIVEVLFK